MATNFIPSRGADLVNWSANFNTLIGATPTAYGLTTAQATAYGTAHTAYANAYSTATDPSTRTKSTIITKDVTRASLVALARQLARIIQANPAVTPAQKADLGLTVREVEPSPRPAPATPPDIDVISMMGSTVKIRLHDATTASRRGKPEDVIGAAVFSFVGTAPPTDTGAWKFEGNTTKTHVDIVFGPSVPPGSDACH
jgi:hypothetical protein